MAAAGEVILNVPGRVYIRGMVSSTAFGARTGQPRVQWDLNDAGVELRERPEHA